MRVHVATMVVLFGCGRIGFAPIGDGGADDADTTRANIAFVTSATTTGSFGGLAGGDALCMTAAAQAGLPGSFVAFLSIPGNDIRDRLRGSRGWVRVDGAPVLATMDDLFAGSRMLNPLTVDEHGATIPTTRVWSGTGSDGRAAPTSCSAWSTGTAGTGEAGTSSSTLPRLVVLGAFGCQSDARLICFETGHDVTVQPTPNVGRVAFLSVGVRTQAISGIGALDTICQSEATAAGLSGTFLAAVATATTAVAARFPADARPWVRLDGTVVADAGALFSGTDLRSFVNQFADGTYVTNMEIWTGSTSPTLATNTNTCVDWTAFNSGSLAFSGFPTDATFNEFWNGPNTSLCSDMNTRLLCLEL